MGQDVRSEQALTPPVAKRVPHEIAMHGDVRADDYFWLREKSSPDVATYLEAENAYAEAVLAPTVATQEKLYQEIVGRIKETDVEVPVRRGEHYYYSRTEEGKQYRIYCRKAGSVDAAEAIVLDLNEIGEREPFVGLGSYEVSDDGNVLAHSLDTTGYRQYLLQFLDLRSGEAVGFTAPRVTSVAWAADCETVFFVEEDDVTKRSYRLFRQRLGDVEPVLVYEEADERFRLQVQRTRSKRFLVLTSSSHTTSEVRVLAAAAPDGELELIAPRRQDVEYYLEHRGADFLIWTNDEGRNFRVARTPVDNPGADGWETVIPHSPEIMRSNVLAFAGFWAVFEREGGLPHLRIVADDGSSHRVEMPEPVYSIFVARNPEYDQTALRFHYQSMTTPDSVFDYHVAEQRSELLKRQEVLGGYDPAAYATERVFAEVRDGVRVPVSLVYRKGTAKDGQRPLYLIGYGSYGFSYPVTYSHARVSLLDRGVVCAIAHIRGGGELGKPWHDDGRMFNKGNTFADFVDVAEFLIRDGWTRPERIAIEGGSAGGLLMGAVANMRPDLFRCVVSHVPFIDVLTTMLDEDLPLTVGEFEEWGNPKVEKEYRYVRTYCPYSNLEAKAYPAMLVKTSFNDSQVMYWEPAKYVARLRTLKTDDNPLLFITNMKGGHGGSSGRYDRFREVALDYAFMLSQLGV